jgi:hypothetical protein
LLYQSGPLQYRNYLDYVIQSNDHDMEFKGKLDTSIYHGLPLPREGFQLDVFVDE